MHLPEEMVAQILNSIPFLQRERLRLVCSQWNRIIMDLKDIKTGSVVNDVRSYRKFFTSSQLFGSRNQNIKKINISGISLGKRSSYELVVNILVSCENVEYLNCSYNMGHHILPALVIQERNLISHKNLRVLKAKQANAKIITLLDRLPNLTELNINQKFKGNAYSFTDVMYPNRFEFSHPHSSLRILKIRNLAIELSGVLAYIESSPNLL